MKKKNAAKRQHRETNYIKDPTHNPYLPIEFQKHQERLDRIGNKGRQVLKPNQ